MKRHRAGYLIDEQWLYAPMRGGAGGVTLLPVALVDRITGRVYSLYLHALTNEQAAALVWGER